MPVEFIQFRGLNTLSLKQLDQMNGVPKGTTFRRFKRREASLDEGRDYFLLRPGDAPELLARLRDSGMIYPSTVNCLLLTESGYRKLMA